MAVVPFAVIGRGLPKRDGAEKATGRTRYLHDLELPRLAHGRILRARFPHARLGRIDTRRAAALPGVLAVLTGEEVEQHPFGFVKDQLALKRGRVRSIRDEVAAVAAETPAIAEEALALIEVEYEELPGLFDPRAALTPDAPLVHEELGTNLTPLRYQFTHGDVDAAFAAAAAVVEGEYRLHFVTPACLETMVAIADWELLNSLLFTLPGSPIIYYGDEIGMGDNIYLGDRNGVRTPMQWSSDRNAGFSRANPQRLFLPVIIDPEYHFEAVNLEAQQNNPHSLLWWMRRLIALRKRSPALSRGDLTFLYPANRKVVAFLRTLGEERVLVVANLSRFVQYVELDLSEFHGNVPIELFGKTPFPPIGKLPYLMTLAPHTFYWFTLTPQTAEILDLGITPIKEMKPLAAPGGWEELVHSTGRSALDHHGARRRRALRGRLRACRAGQLRVARATRDRPDRVRRRAELRRHVLYAPHVASHLLRVTPEEELGTRLDERNPVRESSIRSVIEEELGADEVFPLVQSGKEHDPLRHLEVPEFLQPDLPAVRQE